MTWRWCRQAHTEDVNEEKRDGDGQLYNSAIESNFLLPPEICIVALFFLIIPAFSASLHLPGYSQQPTPKFSSMGHSTIFWVQFGSSYSKVAKPTSFKANFMFLPRLIFPFRLFTKSTPAFLNINIKTPNSKLQSTNTSQPSLSRPSLFSLEQIMPRKRPRREIHLLAWSASL